jgi:hypothetical protein
MNRALADQVKLFREQAEAGPAQHHDSTACPDLEDRLAFGIFLFDRLHNLVVSYQSCRASSCFLG